MGAVPTVQEIREASARFQALCTQVAKAVEPRRKGDMQPVISRILGARHAESADKDRCTRKVLLTQAAKLIPMHILAMIMCMSEEALLEYVLAHEPGDYPGTERHEVWEKCLTTLCNAKSSELYFRMDEMWLAGMEKRNDSPGSPWRLRCTNQQQ